MIVLCSVSLNSVSSSSFIPYPLPGRPSLREMDETKPLLTGPSPVAPIEQPPPYEEPVAPVPYNVGLNSGVPQVGGAVQPPPYSVGGSSGGQTMFVQCRVCQHVIHVGSGSQTRVVKCGNCREATPIAPPPNGKKYVRCPCNCLLTCSNTASRVVCPRENCKRTIGVGTIDIRPINTDRMRVVCGRCHKAILWPANAAVARCPHCRARSYLSIPWMRYRAFACIITGIILLIVATALTAGFSYWASSNGGIYVLWVGLYLSGLAVIIRGVFYCCMTRSEIEH
ncbi:type 1 phosphatidylinositol 4,5-bisphosphate 4-phosphatase-like [Halichondria panicea]|uniref:type 1 phosphatidylinositol 4,5-bisphosphate 4-phosphatase-like n=1 Tax=Halichondria panicea TaxID=6063 RepID=UPI00312B4FC6